MFQSYRVLTAALVLCVMWAADARGQQRAPQDGYAGEENQSMLNSDCS